MEKLKIKLKDMNRVNDGIFKKQLFMDKKGEIVKDGIYECEDMYDYYVMEVSEYINRKGINIKFKEIRLFLKPDTKHYIRNMCFFF
jgi:hypothetical protein